MACQYPQSRAYLQAGVGLHLPQWAVEATRSGEQSGEQKQRTTLICTAWLAALASQAAWAQQYAYPAKGQSPQQQKNDEAAGHSWAVRQTGFDPAKPPPPTAAAKPPGTGSTLGAGARSAMRGAALGEIAGDDAGAASSAPLLPPTRWLVCCIDRLNPPAKPAPERHVGHVGHVGQAEGCPPQQQKAGFAKARAAGLEDRGYTVK